MRFRICQTWTCRAAMPCRAAVMSDLAAGMSDLAGRSLKFRDYNFVYLQPCFKKFNLSQITYPLWFRTLQSPLAGCQVCQVASPGMPGWQACQLPCCQGEQFWSFFPNPFMLACQTRLVLINSYGGSYSLGTCQLKNFSFKVTCLLNKNWQAGRLRIAVPWECPIFFYKVFLDGGEALWRTHRRFWQAGWNRSAFNTQF